MGECTFRIKILYIDMYLKNQIVNDFSICCPGSISVYNLLFIVFGHIFHKCMLDQVVSKKHIEEPRGKCIINVCLYIKSINW